MNSLSRNFYLIFKLLGLLILIILFQLLTSVKAHAVVDQEKIIGQDDLVTVNADLSNIPFRLRKLVPAIGLMKAGCTVTHIGDGYAITAGHCFWASPNLLKNQSCEDAENKIEWGNIEGRKPYLTSNCKEIVAYQQNSEKDFALIKVDPIPSSYIPVDLSSPIQLSDKLTIFSHPNAEPLAWSKMCSVDRQISSGFSLKFIHHSCDTLPGSSGAALINLNTLKIIGIHDGGRAEEGVGKNYGTPLSNTEIPAILIKAGYNK